MTALFIILGIIVFFAFLLSLRAWVRVRFDSERPENSLAVRVGVAFVGFTLVPKKEKKRKVNLSRFRYRNYQKLLKKERLAAEKKAKAKRDKQKEKEIKKAAEKASDKEKSISERLAAVYEIIGLVLREFSLLTSHIHTKINRLSINVGAKDAATVAEYYGAVCASSAALLELIENKTKLKKIKSSALFVNADFFSEKSSAAVDFSLSVTLFSALHVALDALIQFIKKKIKEST